MYIDFIFRFLWVGYYIGFIASIFLFPIGKRKIELNNILLCFSIAVTSIILSSYFVILILGFSTDSTSSYDNISNLFLPVFFGIIVTLIPIIIIKFLIYIVKFRIIK